MAEVKFESHLAEIQKATDEQLARAAEIIGGMAESYAKKNISEVVYATPEGWYIRTGNLRNSITHEVGGDEVYVGTNVEYAPYVEFGHTQEVGRYVPKLGKRLVNSYVPPKPFLAPAVESHMDEYKKMIEYSLRQ